MGPTVSFTQVKAKGERVHCTHLPFRQATTWCLLHNRLHNKSLINEALGVLLKMIVHSIITGFHIAGVRNRISNEIQSFNEKLETNPIIWVLITWPLVGRRPHLWSVVIVSYVAALTCILVLFLFLTSRFKKLVHVTSSANKAYEHSHWIMADYRKCLKVNQSFHHAN